MKEGTNPILNIHNNKNTFTNILMEIIKTE